MPGLTRIVLEAAHGQSAVGSWGHTFARPDGTHAKVVIPELTKIANHFEKEEKDFPRKLMLQKANSVRKTIAAIEASMDTPKLIRII